MHTRDVHNLNSILTIVNYTPDAELKDQLSTILSRRLILSPFGNIIPRDTLSGRLWSWVSTPNEEHWQQAVNRALDVGWSRESLSLTKERELVNYKRQLCGVRVPIDRSVGRSHLDEGGGQPVISEESWAHDPVVLQELSRLDDIDELPVATINADIFRLVNGLSGKGNIVGLLRYLSTRDPRLEDLLGDGCGFERRLQGIVSHGKSAESEQELVLLADDLAEHIKTLETGERFLFFGGCSNSSDHFLTQLSNGLSTNSGGENFGGIDGFSDTLAKELRKSISEGMSEALTPSEQETLKSILEHGCVGTIPEEYRQWIPNFLERILPQILREPLKDRLISSFPEGSGRELAQNIANQGIEEGMRTFLRERSNELKMRCDNGMDHVVSNVTGYLPGIARQFLGQLGIVEMEQPMWFDFVKREDGKFDLQVYSLELAEILSAKDGEINFPLRYEGLTAEQLGQPFFFEMAKYRVWPRWYDKTLMTTTDLHSTLSKHLGKGKSTPKIEGFSATAGCSSLWRQLEAFMTYRTGDAFSSNVLFEMRQRSLYDMWSHVKADKSILQRDLYLSESLREAAHNLVDFAIQLHDEGKISFDEVKHTYATTKEMEQILQSSDDDLTKPCVLPKSLRGPLGSLIARLGAVKDYGVILKEVMIGTFGSEMEEAIDNVIATVIDEMNLESIQPSRIVEELPESWSVRTVIYKLVKWVATHIISTVTIVGTSVLVGMLIGSGLATGLGVGVVNLLVWHYHPDVLARLLPAAWMKQYSHLMDVIRKFVVRKASQAIIKTCLSKETIEEVNQRARLLQQKVSRDGKISYRLFHREENKGVIHRQVVRHICPTGPRLEIRGILSDVPSLSEVPMLPSDLKLCLQRQIQWCEEQERNGCEAKSALALVQIMKALPSREKASGKEYWDRILGFNVIQLTLQAVSKIATDGFSTEDALSFFHERISEMDCDAEDIELYHRHIIFWSQETTLPNLLAEHSSDSKPYNLSIVNNRYFLFDAHNKIILDIPSPVHSQDILNLFSNLAEISQQHYTKLPQRAQDWYLIARNHLDKSLFYNVLGVRLQRIGLLAFSEKMQIDISDDPSIKRWLLELTPPSTRIPGNCKPSVYSGSFWREPLTSPIPAANVSQVLAETLTFCSDINNKDYSVRELINVMRRLEVPTYGVCGYWDEVEDINGCLYSLLRIIHKLNHNNLFLGETTVACYHAYAIIDHLARRCPETGLTDFRIFSGKLIHTLFNSLFPIDNPTDSEQFYNLCHYFGVDPSKRYQFDDIKHFEEQSLFGNSCYEISRDNLQKTIEMDEKKFLASPEGQYYIRLLENPEILRKVAAHGLGDKDKLSEKAILLFCNPLEAECIDEESYTGILPYATHMLRMATYTVRCVNSKFCRPYDFTKNRGFKELKSHFALFSKLGLGRLINRRFVSNDDHDNSVLNTFSLEEPITPNLEDSLLSFSQYDTYSRLDQRYALELSQSSQVAFYGHSLNSLLRMIRSDKEDQVVRAFGFFEKHRHLLIEDYHNIILFRHLILHAGLLRRLVVERPLLIRRFGRFFAEILEQIKNQGKLGNYVWLARLCLKVHTNCADIPESEGSFPDVIRNLVDDVLPMMLATNKNYVPNLCDIVLEEYSDKKPSSDIREEARRYAICLFGATSCHYTQSPSVLRIKDGYCHWAGIVAEYMDSDIELRNEVLEIALKMKGYSVDFSTLGPWYGEFPKFISDSFIIHIAKGEILRSEQEASEELSVQRFFKSNIAHFVEVDAPIIKIGPSRYTVSGSDIVIELEDYESEGRTDKSFAVFKEIEGKKCRFIKGTNLRIDNAPGTQQCSYYWLEEEGEELRHLYGMDKQKCIQVLSVREEEDVLKICTVMKEHEGNFLELLDLNATTHGLSLLSWFYSLDNIEVYTRDGVIRTIVCPGITFDVQDDNGTLRAYCKELAGFYIREEQETFGSYDRYLRLEDNTGQQKVILPVDDVNKSIGIGAIQRLTMVPNSPLFHNAISVGIQVDTKEKGAHYVYDLSEEQILSSDDPEALAYLCVYHFARGNYQLACKYCDELEHLARIKKFSKQTAEFISRIGILSLIDHSVRIKSFSQSRSGVINREQLEDYSSQVRLVFLRLVVSREVNELLLLPEERERSKTFMLSDWFITQYHYDAHLREGRSSLTDYQEDMLIRSLRRRSKKLIKAAVGSLATGIEMVKMISHTEDFVDSLLMTPRIARRLRPQGQLLDRAIDVGITTTGATISRFNEVRRKLESPFGGVRGGLTDILSDLFTYFNNPIVGGMRLLTSGRKSSSILLNKEWVESLFVAVPNDDEVIDPDFMLGNHLLADEDPLPLDTVAITPETITRHFLDYYRLAVGNLPPEALDDPTKEEMFRSRESRFKKMIQHMNGSYDDKTYLMIAYLQIIVVSSSFTKKQLPPFEDLVSALWHYHQGGAVEIALNDHLTNLHNKAVKVLNAHRDVDVAFSGIKAFFGNLAPRMVTGSIASAAAMVTGARTFATSGARNLLSYLPVVGISLARGASQQLISLLPTSRRVEEPPRRALDMLEDEWRESFSLRDRLLGEKLHSLSDTYLEEIETEGVSLDVPEWIGEFSPNPDDPEVIRKGFLEMQQSIVDYYQREDRLPHNFRFKADKNIGELHLLLQQESKLAHRELADYHQRIITFANHRKVRPLGTEREELTLALTGTPKELEHLSFDDLLLLFLQGDDAVTATKTGLTPDEVLRLNFVIYDYLIEATRKQQLNRSLSLLEEMMRGEITPSSVSKLGIELSTSRRYPFDIASTRLLRGFLVFEYRTGNMLWQRQVNQLRSMLLVEEEHRCLVLELIMGLGKTYFGIPTTDFFVADGNSLVVNVWPQALAATNTADVSKQARDIFQQTALVTGFRRSDKLTFSRLSTLMDSLNEALVTRGQFNLTKEDAQALELKGIEALYLYNLFLLEERDLTTYQSYKEEKLLDRYMEILAFVRRNVDFNIDEAHRAFFRKEELNYPIGRGCSIDTKLASVIGRCIRAMLEVEDIASLLHIRENEQHIVDTGFYHSTIKPLIARELSRARMFNVPEDKIENFIEYVCHEEIDTPPWIKACEQYREIALVKGILTQLLPRVLKSKLYIDYGPSPDPEKEYTIPHAGNGNPRKKATIRNPYEAILKTFFMLIHCRIERHQFDKLVKYLACKANQEAKKKSIPKDRTRAARLFKKWSNDIDLFTVSEAEMDQAYQTIRENDRAIIWYTTHLIVPEIRYHELNLRSNVQNFTSMCARILSCTGSPYNRGTYPLDTKVLHDPGTLGDSIDVLMDKCSDADAVEILHSHLPGDLLQEILDNYFIAGTKTKAIVDRGALFKGLSTTDVVRVMFHHCQQHRPDIKAIVFYDHNGDKVIVEIKSPRSSFPKPIAYRLSRVPKEARAAYFDQPRTFAADVPLDPEALAILTVDETTTLEGELSQAMWRMRALRREKQTLKIVMEARVAGIIADPSEEKPSVKSVIKHAKRTEVSASMEEDFLSACSQLHNIVRRAVLDKIIFADDTKQRFTAFREFFDLLISNNVVDPIMLYGRSLTHVPPEQILAEIREGFLTRIHRSSTFNTTDERMIREQMLTVGHGDYPELVAHRIDDIDISQNVEEKEAEAETEQDQALELEQDQHEEVDTPAMLKVKPLDDPPWNSALDISSLQWLKVIKPSRAHLTSILMNQAKKCLSKQTLPPHNCGVPLYTLSAVCAASKEPILARIAHHFSDMIICTNSLIPFMIHDIESSPVEPCSPQQRPIQEILVLQDEASTRIVALNSTDAKYWRHKLSSPTDSPIKMAIYDTELRSVIVAGTNSPDEAFYTSKEFMMVEAQLAFFNGDTSYSPEHLELLAEWIYKCGIRQMEETFKYIHSNRGVDKYDGSDIATLFETLE